ncbi:MAG: CrcB family protein [Thermodesulfobacteriota bacterium]|nr:CrcB family protein [Thermodesulfobacteriota bacterium]
MVMKLVWLALAGALGTLARYGLAGLVHRINGVSFPWGTMTVNLTGCFFAGLLWTLFESRWPVSGEIRAIVLVGFMGAFTTFSAMILESGELLRSAQWVYATVNMVMQNGLGFAALFAGVALGRMT